MARERAATIVGISLGILVASPFAWATLMAALDGADAPAGGYGFMVTMFFGGCLTYGVFVAVAFGVTWCLCKLLRVPD